MKYIGLTIATFWGIWGVFNYMNLRPDQDIILFSLFCLTYAFVIYGWLWILITQKSKKNED